MNRISLDLVKAIGAMVATVLTGAITIWWLVVIANRIGVKTGSRQIRKRRP